MRREKTAQTHTHKHLIMGIDAHETHELLHFKIDGISTIDSFIK